MKEETISYKNKFTELTGINPLRCKLCVGSMRGYVFIEVKGTEEEYNNLEYNYKNVEITFKDFNYYGGKDKIRFQIKKEVLK